MSKFLNTRSLLHHIVSIGVYPELNEEVADRLKVLNIFTWTCISFCLPYYLIMFWQGNYSIGFLFVVTQFLFSISLWLNKFKQYSISKLLILITTNYSVLCLNFTFGFESGFYLYYFTSPLIVYSFFNFKEVRQSVISLILYISSYFIAKYSFEHGVKPWISVNPEMISALYNLNVVLSFAFLIVLASSFSKFHHDASLKISRKNQELEEQQIALESLLKVKNTLLSETHHRVKNNLAVISGLFDLQLMFDNDPKLKSILTNSKNRIKSMSLIHETFYNQSNVSQIDFKKYVVNLTNELQYSMQLDKKVTIQVDMEPVFFDLSKAIPCGLIINEVITNCFKHAFSQTDSPKIIISLRHTENYEIIIRDNGTGFEQKDVGNQNSLGLILIETLTKQLEGHSYFESKNGSVFHLTFNG